MHSEPELQAILSRFDSLRSVIADSSSLIYAQKAGFLALLGEAISIFTIPAVIRETGFAPVSFHIIACDDAGESADTQVLECARRNGTALLTEDRKLMQRCAGKGIPYYNAVMMLCLLLQRGILDWSAFRSNRQKLIQVAHYGQRVVRLADDLAGFVLKTA